MSRWWWGLTDGTRLRVVWLVIFLMLAAAVASCAGSDYSSTEPQPERFYVGGARVIDFTSPEGVPCVVAIYHSNGVALSCNWGAR